MQKTCTNCSASFEITQEDLDFYDEISPTYQDKKYTVPPPTLCPDCRQQRRFSWQNERKFYKRKCSATGRQLISNIAPEAPFPVYEKSYWFSDKWNALEYGREYDFTKSFAENFSVLQREVPRFHIQQQEPMENAEHCNFASNCKNCYLLSDSDYCRDSCYSYGLKKSETCFDCLFTADSELCYQCVDCTGCYHLLFSQNCQHCSHSVFLESCTGCKNCAFSVGLKDKEYCFANQQMSKEQYEQKLQNMNIHSYRGATQHREEFAQYCTRKIHKYQQGFQNENATGDCIFNSKNVKRGFNIQDCWDIAYCDLLYRAKDCMDISSFGENIEKAYECATVGLNSQSCAFCFTAVVNSRDLYYCDTAYSSNHCFGCVCIHRASYCILNKQYTKKEYEELVPKIIGHMQKTPLRSPSANFAGYEWGEFFPVELSPFAYNETVAQEYFPMTKEEVEAKGWKWRDEVDEIPDVEKIIPAEKLPDSIDDIPDDILNWAVKCEATKRPFRIVKQELEFYRKMRLPIPHFHPDERHRSRMALRNPRKLWKRECDKCKIEIQTTYQPSRPEIVYCEQCYLKEVY
ncbi:MAG: hypothetical protein ABIA92_05105 [Patescibacteria group bacterium]